MLSEQEVKARYDKAVYRAAGYYDDDKLYQAYIHNAVELGEILEIDYTKTMDAIKSYLK